MRRGTRIFLLWRAVARPAFPGVLNGRFLTEVEDGADTVRGISVPDGAEERKPKKSRTGFPRTRKDGRGAPSPLGNLMIIDVGKPDLGNVPF